MPELDTKKLDFEHWWKMIAAAGALIVIASIAVKFVPTIFIGLGVLFFGIGEWMQHPERRFPVGPPIRGMFVETSSRIWHPGGLIMDAIGAVFGLVGVVKLLLA